MMKKVYVAGAYSAGNVIDVLKNIGRGEGWGARLFALGFAPFVPWHDKDFILRVPDADFTVEQFYQYSLEWLRVSDCVFVIPGWENSAGTLKEIKEAEGCGIPVYYDLNDLIEKEWEL